MLEAIPHNEGAHKQRLTEDIISLSLIATTGNPSIDYFVSAAVLEAQNRTALSQEDEPYSEQVIVNKQTQNTKTQKYIYIHIYMPFVVVPNSIHTKYTYWTCTYIYTTLLRIIRNVFIDY